MSAWDKDIFSREENVDFLDELSELDPDDVAESVRDAVLLAANADSATEEEIANGLAAATIAAIWSGAPFSAGEIVDSYPFIRSASAEIDEKLAEAAVSVLEAAETEDDQDVDPFVEQGTDVDGEGSLAARDLQEEVVEVVGEAADGELRREIHRLMSAFGGLASGTVGGAVSAATGAAGAVTQFAGQVMNDKKVEDIGAGVDDAGLGTDPSGVDGGGGGAAARAGAEAADAIAVAGESLSIEVRDGALEQAERAEGVEIGRRHFPLNSPFQNGPIHGKEVFIPLSQLIGGADMAGKGWNMLNECLAVGRSITLPSTASGGAKAGAVVTGAYARIRKQFGLSVGRFEGVEEALARIGGKAYMISALSQATAAAVDRGDVCLNIDDAWYEKQSQTPPTSRIRGSPAAAAPSPRPPAA